MNKLVTVGQNVPITFKNTNMSGIKFDAILTAAAVNNAIDGLSNDLSEVVIEAYLHQAGRVEEMYSGDLRTLLEAQEYDNEMAYNFVRGATQELVAEGVAAKNVLLQPLEWKFGTVMNLDGNDKIELKVKVGSGFVSGNSDISTGNDTYLNIDALEGIGVQYYVPKWRKYVLQGAQQNFDEYLGDNIMAIDFVNVNATGSLIADQVISSARVNSDRVDYDHEIERMLSDRALSDLGDETAERYASFKLLAKPADNVKISLRLESANVDASKNFVLVKSFATSKEIVSKGDRMRRRHIASAERKAR